MNIKFIRLGNYRVAQLTQIKHHWWWKMNFVFDGIVKRYGLQDKYVMMLEEDHYLGSLTLFLMIYFCTIRVPLT